MKNQNGQMLIESILILAILTGIAISISKQARDNEFMAGLIEGPWLPIRGMIEDGVWEKWPASKANHPNLKRRHGSHIANPVPTP